MTDEKYDKHRRSIETEKRRMREAIGKGRKDTEISKIIAGAEVEARAVSLRKPTGFSRASVTASLLCFGCFAAG